MQIICLTKSIHAVLSIKYALSSHTFTFTNHSSTPAFLTAQFKLTNGFTYDCYNTKTKIEQNKSLISGTLFNHSGDM